LAHVGLIAAGTYTLTLDGLRGAVLQMIAHGFVVVGLFYAAEIIFRRYETRAIAEMAVFVRNHQIHFDVFDFGISICCLPTTFNFIGIHRFVQSFTNIWFAILGGTTIILGAYYMLKMFQHAMLGETIQSLLLM
jgi:NADH-quinone oxidoreductase subunit M